MPKSWVNYFIMKRVRHLISAMNERAAKIVCVLKFFLECLFFALAHFYEQTNPPQHTRNIFSNSRLKQCF
ncbi:MAG: hypothetical protein B7X39_10560 [Lysobacterales bacterium 14-68-21]|nr:MAG: hypothetical protein B7X45_08380 [Xanthomonadales bacterium 15-68-25]OZB66546.1 MAG: hypothetical protein B7X39_10560 [Xanthomonadales bacterium 14-68-21]